jgi:hypothetical protein
VILDIRVFEPSSGNPLKYFTEPSRLVTINGCISPDSGSVTTRSIVWVVFQSKLAGTFRSFTDSITPSGLT